jgi:hypothetical protein
MSKFIVIPMEDGRRQYINTEQVRAVADQRDEGNVVIEFDHDHKLYMSRERAAPFLKWLKNEVTGG